MKPWERKAHRIIADLSLQAQTEANTRTNGKRYKVHRPYTIPEVADDLVRILGMRDRAAAEVEAKTLFVHTHPDVLSGRSLR